MKLPNCATEQPRKDPILPSAGRPVKLLKSRKTSSSQGRVWPKSLVEERRRPLVFLLSRDAGELGGGVEQPSWDAGSPGPAVKPLPVHRALILWKKNTVQARRASSPESPLAAVSGHPVGRNYAGGNQRCTFRSSDPKASLQSKDLNELAPARRPAANPLPHAATGWRHQLGHPRGLQTGPPTRPGNDPPAAASRQRRVEPKR